MSQTRPVGWLSRPALSSKPEDLSSVSRTFMVEGENQPTMLSCDIDEGHDSCVLSLIRKQTKKYNLKC